MDFVVDEDGVVQNIEILDITEELSDTGTFGSRLEAICLIRRPFTKW